MPHLMPMALLAGLEHPYDLFNVCNYIDERQMLVQSATMPCD